MNKNKLFAVLRIVFGVIIVSAIATQFMDSLNNGRSLINFFSFFTIQSNILAALLLLAIGSYQLSGKNGKQIAFFRGAVTLYMTMTGIIYVLLLSGNEVSLQTTIPWVNLVLHYIMPVVLLADWLLFPPKYRVPFSRAVYWLMFPAAYFVYSIVRGSMTGWYPYPFMNPVMNGWPQVIMTCIVIAAGVALLTWLLALRWPKSTKARTA